MLVKLCIYVVFMFVRDLFSRFLLGYLDKIYIVNFYYWVMIGKEIWFFEMNNVIM